MIARGRSDDESRRATLVIFFTADHHFGHSAVIGYSSRPFADVAEMDEKMISGWKSVVQPSDTVYYLGDFSFSKSKRTEEIFHELPGKKILVQGNHDSKHTRRLFAPFVYEEIKMRIAGVSVKLCHYPYSGDHTEAERFPERRPQNQGGWLIHGHVHNGWKQRDRMICVSVENWDYKPVPLTALEQMIQKWQTHEARALEGLED